MHRKFLGDTTMKPSRAADGEGGQQVGVQHTPTPWGYDLNHTIAAVLPDDEEWGVTVCQVAGEYGIGRGKVSEEDKANAEFIVRACNSHDDMLKALEAIEASGVLFAWANEKGITRDEWKRRCEVVDACTDAISKAVGSALA
jgi:hypothetical protein